MQTLISFIGKYYSFFLFIILEIFCFSFISRSKDYHRAFILNSSSSVTGSVYSAYGNSKEYFNLKEHNLQLLQENSKLRALTAQSWWLDTMQNGVIKDTGVLQCYEYIPAEVINITTHKFNNFITLNRGSKKGIEKDMGVIGPNGIVGIVTRVSENFSTVLSVLHHEFRIRGRHKASNVHGSIQWEGPDPQIVKLNDIGNYIKVEVGDTILTTGFSIHFPKDILIGTVENVEPMPGENWHNIDVKLSTDFKSIQFCYVIDYLLKEEQNQIEEGR